MSAGRNRTSSREQSTKIAFCGLIVGVAVVLMLAGALVLLFCVPCWFWTMLLGLALLAGGFLIFRFCG